MFHLTDSQVLVTGGQGFVGRHVVDALTGLGARPISVVHRDRGEPQQHVGEIVYHDLENRSDAASAVATAEFVIHLAARAGGIQFQSDGVQEVFSTNRRLTDNVLNAAVENGVSRVFLASSSVIYRPASHPIAEDDPILDVTDSPSPYAWSKITDEVVASWYRVSDLVVGRFGNVFGPGAPFDPARSTVVHALIDRAARLEDGEKLIVWGDGSAIRSFIYVKDAAEAALHVLEHGESGEAYNIDGGEPVSIAELAETIRDAVNPSLELVFDDSKPSGAPYRVGSIDKLGALGCSPSTTLANGIRETVDWYRSSGLSED